MAKFRRNLPAFICICVSVVIGGLYFSSNLQESPRPGGFVPVRGGEGKGGEGSDLNDKHGNNHVSLPKPKPIIIPGTVSGTTPDYLKNTAAVTLATGDEAARLAVALMQSLRDVQTQIPHLVVMLSRGGLGSADCNNAAWRKAHGREHIDCGGLDTIAPEIISQMYIDALQKLGATIMVIDPVPDTPYTVIPGGRQIFWGMAFNKLHVFNLTQYRKLLWMDGDTMILKNIDHLLKQPMFSAALTYDCCNPNGPAKPSGGLWVVEPSQEITNELTKLINGPVPGTDNEVWHWGDMQVVKYLFGAPPSPKLEEPYWPSVSDDRHGYVLGLKYIPEIAAMSDQELKDYLDGRVRGIKREHEGFINSSWDGRHPKYVWKMLDIRYDQCVGMCECLPGRDMPKTYMSVHFSCIHHIGKPSKYETEDSFMHALYNYALSCTRYYYLLWYEKYQKAVGRLPAPYWAGPAIPLYNATHDEYVRGRRLADNV